jgi:hypothetical protein
VQIVGIEKSQSHDRQSDEAENARNIRQRAIMPVMTAADASTMPI